MLFDYSPADVDEDLRRQARADRDYRRWVCPECGGGHFKHAQGCPEALYQDEQQDEDQGETT